MIPSPFQIIPVLNSYFEGAIGRHNRPRKISIREKVTLAAAMRPSRASEQARKRRGPYMQIALTHCNRIVIHTQLRTGRLCGRAGLWETGQLGGGQDYGKQVNLVDNQNYGKHVNLWTARTVGNTSTWGTTRTVGNRSTWRRPGLWETGQLC